MSNNDNKWDQPEAPPPPLFTGQKERDIVKQVTDEVIERVIGTSILYYPISIKHSDFHPLYGEAINKTYLPPVHVEVLAEWEGEDTTTTGFGIDKQSAVTIHFHKRRLTEDQNLFVREGDFIQYGEQKYEIVSLSQPTLLFGQVDYKVEVSAKCVRARDGTFPSESYPDPEEDDPRFTAAPACDPIEEIRVLTGDTTSTGGSGEQPCGEVYERPGTPPPPLFTGKKESNLVKQVNDELLERVVGQQVVYFPISVPHSDFHELYGEAINKTFLPPIRVFAAVSWEGSETTTTNYGIDRKSSIQVKFHKRRLSEDQNLFVREGDFVLYGKILYEIVKVGQPKLLFGKIDEKFEVVADCIRAREGTFRLSEVEGVVNEFDLDSVTACDNANLVIPDGVDNTMANVGSGAGVFKNKTGIQFNMKTLVEGENIVITTTDDEIKIDSAGEISGTITNALTASYVETAQTASYVAAANIDGTVLSASFSHTASLAHTASFYLETDTLASVVARGSATPDSISVGELSATDTSITGTLDVSGSTIFGREATDTHRFTGSLQVGSASSGPYTWPYEMVPAVEIDNDGVISTNRRGDKGFKFLAKNSANAGGKYIASFYGDGGSGEFEVVRIGRDELRMVSDGSTLGAGPAGTGSFRMRAQELLPEVYLDYGPGPFVYKVGKGLNHPDPTQRKAFNSMQAASASFRYLEITSALGDSYVNVSGALTADSGIFTSLTASGISAAGHYIPTDDAVYDIGSADKQIRDIYVSTGSIIFGGEHRIEINTDTNTFNFDSPESRGLSIPCVETISSNDYADGTIVYDKTNHKFMFRQDSEWVELGTSTDGNSGGNSGGNTGGGTTNVTVAGIGSGILTLTDDFNGPNRLLLEEYTTNAIAYSGKTLYLANVADNPIGPFVLGAKFYFNEGGVWHPSHFFSSAAQEQAVPAVFPDMQDILSLDATRAEDLAILNGLYQNSASYGGRAIYLSSTGSSPVGPFVQEQKYYFNEGGTWHASSFYSTNEEYEE